MWLERCWNRPSKSEWSPSTTISSSPAWMPTRWTWKTSRYLGCHLTSTQSSFFHYKTPKLVWRHKLHCFPFNRHKQTWGESSYFRYCQERNVPRENAKCSGGPDQRINIPQTCHEVYFVFQDGNLDTNTALIYDAVHLFALALHQVSQIQVISYFYYLTWNFVKNKIIF